MLKAIFTLPQRSVGFFHSTLVELRLIDWMKPKDVAQNTGIVILLITLLVLFLSGADQIVVAIRTVLFSIA